MEKSLNENAGQNLFLILAAGLLVDGRTKHVHGQLYNMPGRYYARNAVHTYWNIREKCYIGNWISTAACGRVCEIALYSLEY